MSGLNSCLIDVSLSKDPTILSAKEHSCEQWNVLVQVVLLGSAPDPCIQKDFENLANELHSVHHDRVRLCLVYDEPLSHLVIHDWYLLCA